MLAIFGYAASINVRKVLWACEEIGIPFVRDDWDGKLVKATCEPAFRAVNPTGMVPAIDDAGVIVWESNTIVRYLAASRGRTDLLPASPAARARVEQWMDWQVSDFNNSWRAPMQVLVRNNPGYASASTLAASIEALHANVAIVDGALARQPFIAGDTFTVADIPIALSLVRWRSIPFERPAMANVDRYLERMRERTGFVQYGREG